MEVRKFLKRNEVAIKLAISFLGECVTILIKVWEKK